MSSKFFKYLIISHLILLTNYIEAKDSFCKEGLPIGSIIPSVTTWNQLGPTGKKIWYPADGSQVPRTSDYALVTNKVRLPDLRSMFLRGMNFFQEQSKTNNTRNDKYVDPQKNRQAGITPQDHSFQKHVHLLPDARGGGNHKRKSYRLGGINGGFSDDSGKFYSGDAVSGQVSSETRPNNIAVFYFIKVNCEL